MPFVDKEKCIGCGTCTTICPQGFEMSGRKARVKDENASCINEAANSCPRKAIIIDKKEETEQGRRMVPQQLRPGTGAGGGAGQGRGMGRASGRGAGRRMGGFGLGPSGECICPNCGYKAPHERGKPCYAHLCPNCGSRMIRGR